MKICKITAFLVVITLLLTFIGCGKDNKTDKTNEPYIIMVNALNGLPVYEQQTNAAQKAATDYGIKFEIMGPSVEDKLPDTEAIVKAYKAEMEKAIAKKPDAIICEPFEHGIYDSVKAAHDAGIPVFCTSNGTENDGDYISYIGTDNAEYGKLAADLLAKKMGNKACVLAVMSDKNVKNQSEQLEAFKKQCAEKYPEMVVADTVYDIANADTATDLFKKKFAENKKIDAVLMLESVGGPSAATVAKNMKRDICILDVDASDKTIENIISGDEWATLAQNFFKRGYESVRMAYEYIQNNGKVDYGKFVDSSVVPITKENADGYEQALWDAVRTKGTKW